MRLLMPLTLLGLLALAAGDWCSKHCGAENQRCDKIARSCACQAGWSGSACANHAPGAVLIGAVDLPPMVTFPGACQATAAPSVDDFDLPTMVYAGTQGCLGTIASASTVIPLVERAKAMSMRQRTTAKRRGKKAGQKRARLAPKYVRAARAADLLSSLYAPDRIDLAFPVNSRARVAEEQVLAKEYINTGQFDDDGNAITSRISRRRVSQSAIAVLWRVDVTANPVLFVLLAFWKLWPIVAALVLLSVPAGALMLFFERKSIGTVYHSRNFGSAVTAAVTWSLVTVTNTGQNFLSDIGYAPKSLEGRRLQTVWQVSGVLVLVFVTAMVLTDMTT